MEITLSGPWKFKGFPASDGEAQQAQMPSYDDGDWLVGKVPGTVHTDLMANQVIPDPFEGQNEAKVHWVADSEWWYRRQFELTPEFLQTRALELVFDGLDTFATVWVNGVLVGEANNMFIPWRFNVTEAMRLGKNTVAVRFKPIYKVAGALEQKYGGKCGCLHAENCSARPYVRKAQYSFGWDWGPTLPTAGIWRNVRLIGYDMAKLGYFSLLPAQVSGEKAKVKAAAEAYAPKALGVVAKFVLEGFGQKIEERMEKNIPAGRSCLECELEISDPKLWWPNGYGEPNLYDATVELYSADALLDKATAKCGIRSVELLQEPDEEGTCFTFAVNGTKVFCRGANWIPADSFLPRVTADRYRHLLDLAAAANMNMLRVWGGGIYEDNAFYDFCDERGIMVWQDFMYACSAYPEGGWFLAEAEREADEAVRRLRGHPCIVVWSGNNEIQWQHQALWRDRAQVSGLSIFNKVLPSAVEKLDGTRPYRPSSPYGGEDPNSECEGTRHNWIAWSKGADYLSYLEDKGRFLSEFGWQAPSTLELLRQYLDEADLQVDSEAFLAHEKQVDGLGLLQKLLSLHYPKADTFKRFVLYAQLNQAEALKTAVTFWRSRMFKTSGCLIWQLDDCWPVVSWSLIDYGLNPKAAYHAVKRSYQPVIAPLIVKQGKAEIYVVNETAQPLEATLRFQVSTFNGEVLFSQKKRTVTPAYTSKLTFENMLSELPLKDNAVFTVTLEGKGGLLYEDARTVAEPISLKLPKPRLKTEVNKRGQAHFEITLHSDVYAKAVRLHVGEIQSEFSDNFFDLVPNSVKMVKCALQKDVNMEEFRKALVAESYPY